MNDEIEAKVRWLEKASRKHCSSNLFKRRFDDVTKDIRILDRFVNLKVNASIQGYWNKIIADWRKRLSKASIGTAKKPFEEALVLSAGYEQQDSNKDGLVDFEEAIRIACENENMQFPTLPEKAHARVKFLHEFGHE